MTPRWQLIGCKGCGSTIVEAALVIAGIPYDREEVDYTVEGPAKQRLLALNPLGQVPTATLPDGTVLTESLAMILHVDELAPSAGLVPRAGDPLRPVALRWLAFVIAALYPTWTYGDEPAKWAGDAGDRLRASTDAHRIRLWQHLEAHVVQGPWFLGERFSALDLYVAVMAHWRPGRAWFRAHAPKLSAIATRLRDDPRLQALWTANFD